MENMHLLALDEEWRLVGRVEASREWRDIVSHLIRIDSQWLIIEQRRAEDSSPSPRWEDIRLSRALSRRLRPIEMKLADHVIRAGRGRFSFREAGLL